MSWNDVSTYIKTQLRPGVLGNTDVQKILNAVLAIVNQIAAGSVDPQNDALWKPDESYAKDVAPVLWMDQWLVSNVPNNTGNVPISTSGTVHPTWRVIGSSSGAGINPWSAIVYPNVLEIVFYQGALYYLDREIAGNGPFASVNFATELSENKWKTLSGSGGGSDLPSNILAGLLAAAAPSAGNPFATLADLPEVVTEPYVINPGRLAILSPTSASLQNAEWKHISGILNFTGNLTLANKPTNPNNRFDIVVGGNGIPPIVQQGTAAADPVVPTPNPGTLLLHVIYRPHTDPDVVIPVESDPSTANHIGQWLNHDGITPIYAPIWKQKLNVNTYYDFQIAFVAFASDNTTEGQYPMNGFLLVDFVTKPTLPEIDNTNRKVSIRTMDISCNNGDFILVMTSADEATIFVRKSAYIGNLTFRYLAKKSTVREDSLIRNGAYIALPAGASYKSLNGRDYISGSGPAVEVTFDMNRQYGFDVPITGSITFPANMGDANNPTRADSNVMVKIRHNAPAEPPMPMPSGVWKKCDGGEYTPNVDNILYMIAHKNAANKVVGVSYTITINTL